MQPAELKQPDGIRQDDRRSDLAGLQRQDAVAKAGRELADIDPIDGAALFGGGRGRELRCRFGEFLNAADRGCKLLCLGQRIGSSPSAEGMMSSDSRTRTPPSCLVMAKARSTSPSDTRTMPTNFLADDLAPDQAGFDEIPNVSGSTPSSAMICREFLGREVGPARKFGHAFADILLGQFQIEALPASRFNWSSIRSSQRHRFKIAGRVDGLEEQDPLLDLEVRDDAVVDDHTRRKGAIGGDTGGRGKRYAETCGNQKR